MRMRRDLWQVLRQGEAEALPRFRAECASKSVDVLDQLFRSKSDQMMHLPLRSFGEFFGHLIMVLLRYLSLNNSGKASSSANAQEPVAQESSVSRQVPGSGGRKVVFQIMASLPTLLVHLLDV